MLPVRLNVRHEKRLWYGKVRYPLQEIMATRCLSVIMIYFENHSFWLSSYDLDIVRLRLIASCGQGGWIYYGLFMGNLVKLKGNLRL